MPKAWIFALPLLLALGLCLPMNAYADQTFEGGTDRPGQDIQKIVIEPGTISGASICRGFCVNNGQCNSWTFVASGVQGNKALCYLKTGVPAAVPNNCCESGVVARALEENIDRPGLDYKRNIITGQPEECQTTCQNDASCVAWTYVNRGVQGPSALCYLKSAVPDAQSSDCCTSGVK